jgi:glucose/arabinose dehydrogenase
MGVCLWLGIATQARAQIAPGLAGKLNVDTTYVTGAGSATDIAFSGDGRAVVTRKTGEIQVRRANGTETSVAYPFGGTFDGSSEKGLLGVVADPDVSQNRAFYFYVSNGPTNDKHRVYRAVLSATTDAFTVDPTPVIAASRGFGPGLEGPANHDGGGLFIHARKLYVSVGDTGQNATPPINKYGSCLNKGNGKILRVNLDGTVPTDNPLVGLTAVSGCDQPVGPWTTAAPDARIFAWGLRNPWRFWIDARTALMWIGDVGESTQEEVSVGTGNRHFGYPFVEGAMAWGNVDGMNCTTLTPSRTCTGPVFSYPRPEGQAVTGGLIPEGCGWTGVFGSPHYLFADSSANWVRALPVNAARTGFSSSTPLDVATFPGAPVSLRMGPDGALYVVYNFDGVVYRFVPAVLSGPDCGIAAAVPARSPWSTPVLTLALGAAGALLLGARLRRVLMKAAT